VEYKLIVNAKSLEFYIQIAYWKQDENLSERAEKSIILWIFQI
jgi:hypothetical protein